MHIAECAVEIYKSRFYVCANEGNECAVCLKTHWPEHLSESKLI